MTPLLLILTTLSFGQQGFDKRLVSAPTSVIVEKIEAVNVVMGSAVYGAGIRPKQYDNFEELKKIATTEELTALTNHPNSVVRCYSLWALAYDKSVDLFPIVVAHINDDEMVETQFGCIRYAEKTGDFFMSVVAPEYTDVNANTLDSVQTATLDSILICSDNNLQAKVYAIGRAGQRASLYPTIRELAIRDNNQAALVALAKYQNVQDIPFILHNKEKSEREEEGYVYTYQAIREFSHADFFPLLEKNLHNTLDNTRHSYEWEELYKAIAVYKNAQAITLLKMPFTDVQHEELRARHIDFVYEALCDYRCPLYDSLLWQLWIAEDRISPDIYQYLFQKNPEKALEQTRKNLLELEKIYSANNRSRFGNWPEAESLTVMMLDCVVEQDKEFGLKLIRTKLKEAEVLQFLVFADKAMEVRDTSFIEPLFTRLSKEANYHVYLKAVKVLLLYNNRIINNRILKARKKNRNMRKDWGGKVLDKLLKEHGLQ